MILSVSTVSLPLVGPTNARGADDLCSISICFTYHAACNLTHTCVTSSIPPVPPYCVYPSASDTVPLHVVSADQLLTTIVGSDQRVTDGAHI